MTQPFVAEIRAFSFQFAPKTWAMCNGQLLAINQNQALFSLIGTTYGGNGVTTFALPNLQSRTPVHWGSGGINPAYGQVGGEESHTLTLQEMPAHNHTFAATTASATKKIVAGGIMADDVDSQPVDYFAAFNAPNSSYVPLIPGSMSQVGGSQAHSNIQPYLTVNICIALSGIFPSRN